MKKKLATLFFSILLVCSFSVAVFADNNINTNDTTAISGSIAQGNVSNNNPQAIAEANLQSQTSSNVSGVSAAGGNVNGVKTEAGASTGPSSAEVKIIQNSTGSKIHPNPPQGVNPPVVQNFGPVGNVANVKKPAEIKVMFALTPEWTEKQTKKLIKRKTAHRNSRAIMDFPPLQAEEKVKIVNLLGLSDDDAVKRIKELGFIHVGNINNKTDKKGDSDDVLGQSLLDCRQIGGNIFVLTAADGEIQIAASGWSINVGGDKSSVSGSDGGLATVIVGGIGYGNGKSQYKGEPFTRGFACRDSSIAATVKIEPVPESKPAAYVNDEGMPNFSTQQQQAVGAGIVNGH